MVRIEAARLESLGRSPTGSSCSAPVSSRVSATLVANRTSLLLVRPRVLSRMDVGSGVGSSVSESSSRPSGDGAPLLSISGSLARLPIALLDSARRLLSVDVLSSRSEVAREGAAEAIGDSNEGTKGLRKDDRFRPSCCKGSGRGVYAGEGPLFRRDRSRMWRPSSSSALCLRERSPRRNPSYVGIALALRGI
jgi:hypothetical protein